MAHAKNPPPIPEEAADDKTAYLAMCENISHVEVVTGPTPRDPDIWRFHLFNKTIEMDTDSFLTWKRFSQQYLKIFRKRAPSILAKKSVWNSFLDWIVLEENGFLIGVAPEVDDKTYVANYILERVAGLEVTTDIETFSAGQHLLPKTFGSKEFLVLPHESIKEFMNETGVRLDIGVVGTVLIGKGAKGQGTPQMRIRGISTHIWPFEIGYLEKMRDDPFVWEGRS